MNTFWHILSFASGCATTWILSYYFSKPTNEYNGSVRIKQKGRNNVQDNDVRAEITSGMKRREVISIWRSLRKQK